MPRYHIYAIELDEAVLRKPRFRRRRYRGAYYVGHTWHKPWCRFRQHAANGQPVECRCRGGQRMAKGKKAGECVGEFGRGPDYEVLPRHDAPTRCKGTRADAVEKERQASEILVAAGFAVLGDQAPEDQPGIDGAFSGQVDRRRRE